MFSRHILFLLLIIGFQLVYCVSNQLLITSIHVTFDDEKMAQCVNSTIKINNSTFDSSCSVCEDGKSMIFLSTSPNNQSLTANQSFTMMLNGNLMFTGSFKFPADKIKENVMQKTNVSIQAQEPNKEKSTTAKPSQVEDEKPIIRKASATLNWILLIDETPTVIKNSNSGAVTIAIIEGFVLLGILLYAGYKTYLSKKKLANSSMSYPPMSSGANAMRMNDLPAQGSRDSTYYNQAPIRTNATSSAPATTPMKSNFQPTTTTTTPELVVPANTTNPPSGTNNQAFNDPFDNLNNW